MKNRVTSNRFYLVLLVVLTISSCVAATLAWWRVIGPSGTTILDVPFTVLFAVLFLWIAIGFWTATFGFVRQLVHRIKHKPANLQTELGGNKPSLPKTAIVMPVYNEDPASVFAGIRAICDDLASTDYAASFDFFVLSDTTDPDLWLEEESAWAWARMHNRGSCGIFYRRRPRNTGRKCGNIADFCHRWGGRYPYMVVLDADSLMTGATLVEMVSRMERTPHMGILQVPPVPVSRTSLLARLQQFSAQLYGEVFTSGYALWVQKEGNYWGHNAIIRTRPFAECCGLSLLPGKPPLGGELLSHDFVEAALIQAAGWQVVVADDLSGSYEECPTTLIDFATRDRRWCQGNMQHLRLIVSRHLKAVSRIHLAMGAMSFLASPLWLCFLILAVMRTAITGHFFDDSAAQPSGGVLFGVIMLLLFLPKLAAIFLALLRPARLALFGGPVNAASSVLLETVASVVIAPIMMVYHSFFVVATFLRRSVAWDNQQRSESHVSLHDALVAHAPHTILGLTATVFIQWVAPSMLFWISPVLLGLVFSIPGAMLLGSRRVGLRLRRRGLLLIPEESVLPAIIRRKRKYVARYLNAIRHAPHPFLRTIVHPALNSLHMHLLPAANSTQEPNDDLRRLMRVVLSGGAGHLSRQERMAIASNPLAMEWLHLHVWKEWPLTLLERIATTAWPQSKAEPSSAL